jgi:gliding motility-associated-like protein
VEPTTYEVQIVTTCKTITRYVKVDIVDVNLGPDVTVCNNAQFTINPNALVNENTSYAWIGTGLSCTDCSSPELNNLPTGTHTYIATLSTPGCVVQDTLVVNVLPGQQAQYNIIADTSICFGQTISIGGIAVQGVNYTWTSDPSGANSIQSDPSVSPAQTTRYFISALSGDCPVPSLDSVLITVLQPPVLDLQSDTLICEGQSVSLGTTEAEDGVTYTWSPNDGTLSSTSAVNPIAIPEQSTAYSVLATNGACTLAGVVNIEVTPLDIELNVEDTLLLCKGEEINVAAIVTPPNINVTWSPSTVPGLFYSSNGHLISGVPEESILLEASIQAAGCSRKLELFVKVDSLPDDLSIKPQDTTICQGKLIYLLSPIYEPAEYKDITFEWTPQIWQLTPDSLYNMVVQPNDTVTYRRVSRNGACVQEDSATINVIVPPQLIVLPSDTSICPGNSVQLTVLNAEEVEMLFWSPDVGLSCSDCTTPLATPESSTPYQVGGMYKGCPVGASANINVIPPPPYQFPSELNVCEGDSLLLNSVGDATNGNYTWTSTDPSFGTVTTVRPKILPTQNATYFLTASNGCPVSDQFSITVLNGNLKASNDTSLCLGASAILVATGNLNGNYEWSDGQSGQAISITPTVSGTYTVTYTFGSSCVLTEEINVEVKGELPEVVFPIDNQLCAGESISLNSANTTGAVYTWSSEPAGFTFVGANPPPQIPGSSIKYNVTATLDGCLITESLNVIVYGSTTLNVSPDTTICEGEPLLLSADGSVTGTYTWTASTGQTYNTASITILPDKTTTYNVEFTFGDDCTLMESVTVTVVPTFDIEILADPDTTQVNLGQVISLSAFIDGQSLQGYTFGWFQDDQSLGNSPSITQTISGKDSSITYLLIGTNVAGCSDQAVLTLTVLQPEVLFPNAFTPDGDKTNDVFKPFVRNGSIQIEEMSIYNRWGQRVFKSNDSNAAWDGRTDGEDAAVDVYVYVVKYRLGDGALQPVAKGEINLIR